MAIFIFDPTVKKIKIERVKILKMKSKQFIIVTVSAAILMFAGLASAQKRCNETGSIKSVTKSSSGNFELVTFEVLSAKPTFKVSNSHPPFSMYGSEKPLRIKGNAFKSVVIRDVVWTCTIAENLSAKTSTITAVKNVEQFEGQVEYVVGYSTRSKFVSSSSTHTRGGKSTKITLKFKK